MRCQNCMQIISEKDYVCKWCGYEIYWPNKKNDATYIG